jgi:hypothetical protein
MDIVTGVKVECADSPCGQSRYVILNPANATITHLVVGEREAFAKTRLVPFSYVSESSPELIRLQCTRAELDALPQFSDYEYVKSQAVPMAYSLSELWMGPLAAYWPIWLPEERQHVPEGELSIQRGAQVEATDGHIGSVDGFLVEPASGHITHLILRRGHLWGRRDITIPVSEIACIEQDTVHLRIDKVAVGTLTSFQPGKEEASLGDTWELQRSDTAAGVAGSPGFIESRVIDLASSDRRTREGARQSLVRIGLPAVKPLAAALTNRDSQVRWESAKALQQIADPTIAPAMVAALEDDDPGVQWIAAEALALLGRAGTIPLLKALTTRSDSPGLRRGAHHVLRLSTDENLKRETAPVLAALESIEQELEVPVAAGRALAALEGWRSS